MRSTGYSSILEKGANNLNLIRLMAALAVIYAHSYAFTPVNQGEWVARKTGVTHAGELSVVVFFFISGALVTKSLVQSRHLVDYGLKRAFRIYPALILCCFFVAYVVPFVFGGVSLSSLFSEPGHWRYFKTNSLGVWNEHFIPGVFEDHFQKSLNGSLWSITLELRLYLFLAVMALLGLMNSVLLRCISLLALLVLIGVVPQFVPLLGLEHGLYGGPAFPGFSSIFLLGGLFYVLERRLRVNFAIAVVVLGLLVLLTKGTGTYRFAIFAFTVAAAMWLATLPWLVRRWQFKSDYSYGVYLYGWPAQQIAYAVLKPHVTELQPWHITAVAMPLALGLAALSWHFLEEPALGFARRLSAKYRGANGFRLHEVLSRLPLRTAKPGD